MTKRESACRLRRSSSVVICTVFLCSVTACTSSAVSDADDVPAVSLHVTDDNDSGLDLRLLMDTGAEITVFDQSLADELTLTFIRNVNVSGGTDAHSEAGIYLAKSISLGGAYAENTPVLMMDLVSRGGPFLHGIDGIFSAAAFAPSLTEFDLARGSVTILPPEDEPDTEFSVYTESDTSGLPQARVTIDGLEILAVIDTGAPDLIILPMAYAEELPLKTALTEGGRSRTVNDENVAFQAQLDGLLEISGHTWDSPAVTFLEDQSGPVIGMDALGGALVTLDPANGRAWLRWPEK